MNNGFLREFLVRLGFKIDHASFGMMKSALGETTADVAKLGAAIEIAAGAVVAGVGFMADSMEKLYFASQRTGSTVQALQAVGFAAANLGSTSEAALSSMEGLAAFLRSSPGAAGMLRGLGVDPTQGSAAMMSQLGERFKSMPFYLAKSYAGAFGIDEKTLIAMINDTGQYGRVYSDMLRKAGVDSQAAATGSHALMVQIRTLGAAFDILDQKIMMALSQGASNIIERFTRFITDHFTQITNVVSELATGIIAVAETLIRLGFRAGQVIGDLVGWFQGLSDQSQRFLEMVGLIVVAWKLVNEGFLATPLGMLTAVTGALLLLYDDYQVWKEGGKSLIDWSKWQTELNYAYDGMHKLMDWFDRILSYLGPDGMTKAFDAFLAIVAGRWAFGMLAAIGRVAAGIAGIGTEAVAASAATLTALGPIGLFLASVLAGYALLKPSSTQSQDQEEEGIRNTHLAPGEQDNGVKATDFFVSKGMKPEAAAAMAAQLRIESGFDPKAIGDNGQAIGIAQWHPDRQAAIAAHFGKRIQDMNLQEQLEAVHWERSPQGPEAAAGAAMNNAKSNDALAAAATSYERPRDTDQRISIARNQQTDILSQWRNSQIGNPTDAAKNIQQIGNPTDAAKNIQDTLAGARAAIPSSVSPAPLGGDAPRVAIPSTANDNSQSNVNIAPTTNITVHANGADPQLAADAVGNVVQRTNADLVRNTQGATR